MTMSLQIMTVEVFLKSLFHHENVFGSSGCWMVQPGRLGRFGRYQSGVGWSNRGMFVGLESKRRMVAGRNVSDGCWSRHRMVAGLDVGWCLVRVAPIPVRTYLKALVRTRTSRVASRRVGSYPRQSGRTLKVLPCLGHLFCVAVGCSWTDHSGLADVIRTVPEQI